MIFHQNQKELEINHVLSYRESGEGKREQEEKSCDKWKPRHKY